MCNQYNNYQRPVSHDPSREDLESHSYMLANTVQTISSVEQGMAQTGNIINNARQEIAGSVDEIKKALSKVRKKKGGCEFAKTDEKFVMVQNYTDGSSVVKDFFTNVGNTYQGSVFQFPAEITTSEIVEIFFDEKMSVIFSRKNMNGEKLYQAFLKAGVHFNSEIPVGVVKRELEKFILPAINNFPVYLIIPVSGWDEKNWFHTGKDYSGLSKWIEFPDLPIKNKIFPSIPPEKRQGKEYFELVNQIKDRKLKDWVMLYPFFSLIASLLSRCKCELDYCINIVAEDEAVRREICKRMAIFNRESISIISLEESKSNLNREFAKYGDDVIFLSADMPEMRDYNIERKLQTNVEYAVNILAKRRNLPSPYRRPVYAGTVIFTNFPLAQKGVMSVYADRDDFCVFHSDDYITYDWIYQEFIRYVGVNYDKVTSYLKKTQFNASTQDGMRCLLQIINEFCRVKKVNIVEQLNVANLDSIVNEMYSESEFVDEIELFRILARKAIRSVPTYEAKDQNIYAKNFCMYTKEYLLIPVGLFNQWLENEKVLHIKKKVLNWLSVNGYLKVHERYIYKYQNAGSRYDTYCISLAFFNKVGDIPIEKLGGNISHDCR